MTVIEKTVVAYVERRLNEICPNGASVNHLEGSGTFGVMVPNVSGVRREFDSIEHMLMWLVGYSDGHQDFAETDKESE